jgi:hypothetical protein
MIITPLPSLILFSISKVVAPVASKMDPRYVNLLTALICPVSVTIHAPGYSVKYSVFPTFICSPHFMYSSTSFLYIYSASFFLSYLCKRTGNFESRAGVQELSKFGLFTFYMTPHIFPFDNICLSHLRDPVSLRCICLYVVVYNLTNTFYVAHSLLSASYFLIF